MTNFHRLHVQGFERRSPNGTCTSEVLGLVIKDIVPKRPENKASASTPKLNQCVIMGGKTIAERTEGFDRQFKEIMKAYQARSGQNPTAEQPLRSNEPIAPIFSHKGTHVMDIEPRATDVLGVPV